MEGAGPPWKGQGLHYGQKWAYRSHERPSWPEMESAKVRPGGGMRKGDGKGGERGEGREARSYDENLLSRPG